MSILAYLAGPEVFLPNALEIGAAKRRICERHGLKGLFPLDNEVEVDTLPPRMAATKIFEGNIDMLQRSNVVIANLTPFRGPSVDDGTAYEVGYAHAMKIPVVGYSNVRGKFAEKGLVSRVGHRNLSGEIVDGDNMKFEPFELPTNLMLSCTTQLNGDAFFEGSAEMDSSLRARFLDLSIFERCVIHVAEHMTSENMGTVAAE